ncbi:MAG: methylated-DNA--[protein]-cysteine S-methyltransferase [Leptolyngbya sp. SIOISBB]|nr:methylated-DNA--[protein]-cysteine S-methyltransferase [Leptolyngbya sp. SIOISBB]
MSDSQTLSSDYERIAAAIAFIQAHHDQQPDLATIAQHVYLSEHHCQKLFTRWAGVSPKRFVQLLTLESTKRRLATTQSLLSVALDSGLSSPSRLHDLYVRFEAMTPADYRDGGKGLDIAYGLHATRFGPALIAQTERGICNLLFCEPDQKVGAADWLQRQWPQAKLQQRPEQTQLIADRLNQSLAANGQPLAVLVKGTNFQIQVWRALLTLPSGRLATYQDVANQLGKPKAARAVGTAIGANPVGYFIPCHRVIRATGEIGGYRWGPLRKTMMLGWEAAQYQEDT